MWFCGAAWPCNRYATISNIAEWNVKINLVIGLSSRNCFVRHAHCCGCVRLCLHCSQGQSSPKKTFFKKIGRFLSYVFEPSIAGSGYMAFIQIAYSDAERRFVLYFLSLSWTMLVCCYDHNGAWPIITTPKITKASCTVMIIAYFLISCRILASVASSISKIVLKT
jgi:hypothetical protein